MLGAIYTGLAGMTAFSKGLEAISKNVANMNTLGYKENTVSFQDMFTGGGNGGLTFDQPGSTTLDGGVRESDKFMDFQQGDLRQTTNDLDLAIQGSGFLVLKSGDQTYYGRTGQFAVDDKGFITLQGTEDHLTVLNAANQAVEPNIDSSRTSAPAATTKITFADNLSSTATTAAVSNIKVYDANGGQHVWNVAFAPAASGNAGEWTVTVTDENNATVGTSTLKFNGSAVDPTTATMTVSTTPAGAPPLSVILDFSSGVTSFSGGTTSTLRAASVDGNATGALSSVTVDNTGQLTLTYSNGKTTQLGAVALADFRNPQELQRVGSGLFKNAGNGEMRLLASGSEGIGTLVSKELEASNVDLASEFGDLILIQRGFQASSQVVSVTNDMIQQLFGIRGQ